MLRAGLVLDRPNQAWVAGITYVRLPTCFIYLVCILDAFSRRCVGWQLSRTIDTQLTLAALNHLAALSTTCTIRSGSFKPKGEHHEVRYGLTSLPREAASPADLLRIARSGASRTACITDVM